MTSMSDKKRKGLLATVIGPKKEWRAYQARVKALPPNYRDAVEAIERYLMHFGVVDADGATALNNDVIDLFERAAADGTPIRDVVGDDPVEFVEALIANYAKGGYIDRERARLVRSIEEADAAGRGDSA
jgi:DNA-binding ferritin-like protein (Dps family)